jgi:hypothetical protein
MADSQIVTEWLQKADEDFAFAASIVEQTTFYAQIVLSFSSGSRKVF